MATRNKLLPKVHPAVIAVWSALIASAHMLPAVVLLGTGGTMSVSTALLPLAGIFFGPVAGGLCAAIGQFIGFLIAPSGAWLGMFTWMIGTCNAITAGLLAHGYGVVAVGLSLLGNILWFTTKIGRTAWIFAAVFGGLGLFACLVGAFICKRFLLKKNILFKMIAIFFCGFGGMVVAAMFANYAGIQVMGTPAITWKMLTPVSPVERAMFSVAAVVVGTPLLIGLPKIGIYVGPQTAEEDIDDDIELDAEVEK